MLYFFQSQAETRFRFPHGILFCQFFSQVISGQQFPKPKGSTAKGDVSVAVVVTDNVLFMFVCRWLWCFAHCFSSQVIDPFVTIEVFGIPADISQERTRTVPHNGRYSSWCDLRLLGTFYSNFSTSFWVCLFFLQVIIQSSTKPSSFTSISLISL